MKLTIAIPSHNKTELLNEALKSILKEINGNNDIDVHISDNSLGHDTQELVKNIYSNTGYISYTRSTDAPSLDENVHKAVVGSNGVYVWIFGDDDVLLPMSVDRILNFIEKNDPGIVIVNSTSFNDNGLIEDRRVELFEDKVYGLHDNDQFLVDFGGYTTYVPSIIIKKNLWIESHSGKAFGTYFSHIDTIFRAKMFCDAGFISQPCIGMRVSSQTWTALHYRIWNTLYPEVIWNLDGYSESAKQKVTPQFLQNKFKPILSARAYGRLNFDVLATEFFPNKSVYTRTKVFAFFVNLVPVGFLKFLYLHYIDKINNKKTKSFSPKLAKAQLRK